MRSTAAFSTTVIAAVLMLACSRAPDATKTAVPAAPIAGLPHALRVEQRTTTEIPGSDGKVRLTIDDITGGQVMVTLLDDAGHALLGPISMRAKDEPTFTLDGARLRLRLEKLDGSLLGTDFAEFTLEVAPRETALAEHEKIERLILAVERLEGATFLRNGSEHDARDAADHLRRKLSAAGDDVVTAEQFVEQVAARSSLSGEEYRIRFSDGRTTTLRAFLAERLATM